MRYRYEILNKLKESKGNITKYTKLLIELINDLELNKSFFSTMIKNEIIALPHSFRDRINNDDYLVIFSYEMAPLDSEHDLNLKFKLIPQYI